MAQRELPREHEQPLLLGLVVVGAERLAGRNLVHRGAEASALTQVAAAVHARLVGLGVVGVVLEFDLVDVDVLHSSPSKYSSRLPRRTITCMSSSPVQTPILSL